MAQTSFPFRPFTQHSFYTELNSQLIDLAGVAPGQRIVDLACGTGAVSSLLLEKLRGARDSLLIAIDHSAIALRQAREDLGTAYNNLVQFVQAKGEHLSEAVLDKVDMVFLCNAIHMVPDKNKLISEVKSVLRPGGTFAFNSAFFQGTNTPETDQFLRRWMFRALRTLKHDYNITPKKTEKVESRKHLTVEEYTSLLNENGFHVAKFSIELAAMPLEAWIDISSFDDFITGIMPGVPLDKASGSLKKAVTQVFDEMSLESVPRNWLGVVAIRN
jgi:ubiquinone/menaquinone biosynthesis C-methylase UbiE